MEENDVLPALSVLEMSGIGDATNRIPENGDVHMVKYGAMGDWGAREITCDFAVYFGRAGIRDRREIIGRNGITQEWNNNKGFELIDAHDIDGNRGSEAAKQVRNTNGANQLGSWQRTFEMVGGKE